MTDDGKMGPDDRRAYIEANGEALFAKLVRYISPHTYPDSDAAEDLVQEAITESVEPTSGLNDRDRIEKWMQTLVWRAYARWCERQKRERDVLKADTPYFVRDGVVDPEMSPETFKEGIRARLLQLRDRPDIQTRYKLLIDAILAVGGPDNNEDIASECINRDPDYDRKWVRRTKSQLVWWIRSIGLDPREYGFHRSTAHAPKPVSIGPRAGIDWSDALRLKPRVADGWPRGWHPPPNRGGWGYYPMFERVDIKDVVLIRVADFDPKYRAYFRRPVDVRLPEDAWFDGPVPESLRAARERLAGPYLSWVRPVARACRRIMEEDGHKFDWPWESKARLMNQALFWYLEGVDSPAKVSGEWERKVTLFEAAIDIGILDGTAVGLSYVRALLFDMNGGGTVEVNQALRRCHRRALASGERLGFADVIKDAAIQNLEQASAHGGFIVPLEPLRAIVEGMRSD